MASRSGFPITPSDSTDLPGQTTGGIWVGTATAGTLTVITSAGAVLAFAGLSGGTLIPIIASRVLSTGTSASNLVGLL